MRFLYLALLLQLPIASQTTRGAELRSEYDPSRLASQKRRKTRMRRAMIDRRNPARESGARQSVSAFERRWWKPETSRMN